MEIKENEIRLETIEEFQKSQLIRLVDVFVIAPICVYAGVKYYNQMPKWLSLSLIVIGASTAFYNGKNFLVNKNKNNLVSNE
jgi:hypothetical protein